MARWEPGTEERLVEAALDLYAERGYEHTTVGDIAARVGVTSRTYFRYFPDKREVLFGSGRKICEAIVAGTRSALASTAPFEAMLIGIAESASVFQSRDFARRREAVVAVSAELRERELVKLAEIASEVSSVLEDGGCEPEVARLTADAGVSVFVEATRRWKDADDTPFAAQVEEVGRLLRQAVAAHRPATR